MTKIFNWFNLPETIKENLTIPDEAAHLPCINKTEFNAKVAKVKWNNLPKLVQDIVDQINTDVDSQAPSVYKLKVTWFNLITAVDAIHADIQIGADICPG